MSEQTMDQVAEILHRIARAIVEIVDEVGGSAPSGVVLAALHVLNVDTATYRTIIDHLVGVRVLKVEHHVLNIADRNEAIKLGYLPAPEPQPQYCRIPLIATAQGIGSEAITKAWLRWFLKGLNERHENQGIKVKFEIGE